MEKTGWKIMAIIELVLLIVGIGFLWLSLHIANQEVEKQNICYYDLCGEYIDAWYSENICYCYEEDVLGTLVVAKSQYMK